MKWFLTFVAGAVAGAIALFASAIYVAMKTPAVAPPAEPPQVAIVTVTPPGPPVVTAVEAGYVDVPAFELAVPVPLPDVPVPPLVADVVVPLENQLLIPVAGVEASALKDTFHEARGTGHFHEAIDILAPTGTQVVAVADGKIAKLFNSKPGGLTVYQFDTREKFAYYYAHLDRYAPTLKEGMRIKRGDVLGFVGSTGNADPKTPHLHFAIFALGTEKQWWKGSPVNPYPMLGATRGLAVVQ
jgi:murein DD-endopeptidase MepM/ murein hydrolase activator NlpD